MNRKAEIFATVSMLMLAIGVTIHYSQAPLAAKANVFEWRISNTTNEFQGEPAPVVINKIAREGKTMKFGETFNAPMDGLTNASVHIRNVSDKEIKDIAVVLMLVDPATNRPKAKSSTLKFKGRITPNGEATGIIDTALVDQIQRLSKHSGVPLTQLRLGIDWVEFSDSSRWMYGAILLLDPERPGRWYVKGTYPAYQEYLKQNPQGGDAVYSKASTQSACSCCYLSSSYYIGCQRYPDTQACPGSVLLENFTTFPIGGPKYNFDAVMIECSTNCFQYPWQITGSCPD
ncbi:MAG TPA: hypothetical protein PLD20_22605 [Blastocatellia bacterium]|nr:hypothetical protein [Blastocatellia bacterium]HMX26850.1 hypothetical protein [Blastocatellia bacterium]HMZ20743.1 hypothetical protein [Blastocatellia bacterium]HNG33545.1 hypothetical protein [Blastocatellia bacterium]